MTDSVPIRVFLADDHTLCREGLAALLAADRGMQIVGQCDDGLKVVEMVEQARPDVVVLGIALPGLNGLDVCRELTQRSKAAVLILTRLADAEFVSKAFARGASGYLLKTVAGKLFLEAVRQVARGEKYVGPGVSQEHAQQAGQFDGDAYESLTNRERQVLQLIAEGRTNKQIAQRLSLAPKTVDTHRTRLMRKLNIHDQTTLVKYALKKGIVQL